MYQEVVEEELAAALEEVGEGEDAVGPLELVASQFVDVLMAMVAWGDRWTAGEAGPPVLYRHRACGQIAHVEAHCAACGEILRSGDVDVEPGPGMA